MQVNQAWSSEESSEEALSIDPRMPLVWARGRRTGTSSEMRRACKGGAPAHGMPRVARTGSGYMKRRRASRATSSQASGGKALEPCGPRASLLESLSEGVASIWPREAKTPPSRDRVEAVHRTISVERWAFCGF